MIGILLIDVAQQPLATTNHLQQALAGPKIFFVAFEVFAQPTDPLREDGNLNIRRASICIVNLVLVNDLLFAPLQ